MTEEEKRLSECTSKSLIDALHKCDTIMADIDADIRNCEIYLGLTCPFGDYIDVCREIRKSINTWTRRVVSAYQASIECAQREARLESKINEKTE